MDAFSKPCSKAYYPASQRSGERPLKDIRLIVMHDTEGGTAESIARYFASASAGGSTHLVVDDVECYRCLANTMVPWGAPGANYQGFHIEQCGYARWSAVIWRSHLRTLKRAAYKAAFHCVKFDIPAVFLDAVDLKAGRKGITTHAECTKAFGPSSGHTDPGPFWPRRLFMSLVRKYVVELDSSDE